MGPHRPLHTRRMAPLVPQRLEIRIRNLSLRDPAQTPLPRQPNRHPLPRHHLPSPRRASRRPRHAALRRYHRI